MFGHLSDICFSDSLQKQRTGPESIEKFFTTLSGFIAQTFGSINPGDAQNQFENFHKYAEAFLSPLPQGLSPELEQTIQKAPAIFQQLEPKTRNNRILLNDFRTVWGTLLRNNYYSEIDLLCSTVFYSFWHKIVSDIRQEGSFFSRFSLGSHSSSSFRFSLNSGSNSSSSSGLSARFNLTNSRLHTQDLLNNSLNILTKIPPFESMTSVNIPKQYSININTNTVLQDICVSLVGYIQAQEKRKKELLEQQVLPAELITHLNRKMTLVTILKGILKVFPLPNYQVIPQKNAREPAETAPEQLYCLLRHAWRANIALEIRKMETISRRATSSSTHRRSTLSSTDRHSTTTLETEEQERLRLIHASLAEDELNLMLVAFLWPGFVFRMERGYPRLYVATDLNSHPQMPFPTHEKPTIIPTYCPKPLINTVGYMVRDWPPSTTGNTSPGSLSSSNPSIGDGLKLSASGSLDKIT